MRAKGHKRVKRTKKGEQKRGGKKKKRNSGRNQGEKKKRTIKNTTQEPNTGKGSTHATKGRQKYGLVKMKKVRRCCSKRKTKKSSKSSDRRRGGRGLEGKGRGNQLKEGNMVLAEKMMKRARGADTWHRKTMRKEFLRRWGRRMSGRGGN